MSKNKFTCYVDGACSCNPGPGGWAFTITNGLREKTGTGYEPKTTNNRMELTAAIKAIKFFIKTSNSSDYMDLHSDSSYVVNAFEKGWLKNWIKNDYRKNNGDNITNRDLWEEMTELINLLMQSNKVVNFIKVKGHNGIELNEKVDKLAKEQISINN